MKVTLVIGASDKPERYSYLAVQRLVEKGEKVIALGVRPGQIEGVPILTGKPQLKKVHTVSLYLNQYRQKEYYDYILGLKPERIIFNPGTENVELFHLAEANGIAAEYACTLVMLSTGVY